MDSTPSATGIYLVRKKVVPLSTNIPQQNTLPSLHNTENDSIHDEPIPIVRPKQPTEYKVKKKEHRHKRIAAEMKIPEERANTKQALKRITEQSKSSQICVEDNDPELEKICYDADKHWRNTHSWAELLAGELGYQGNTSTSNYVDPVSTIWNGPHPKSMLDIINIKAQQERQKQMEEELSDDSSDDYSDIEEDSDNDYESDEEDFIDLFKEYPWLREKNQKVLNVPEEDDIPNQIKLIGENANNSGNKAWKNSKKKVAKTKSRDLDKISEIQDNLVSMLEELEGTERKSKRNRDSKRKKPKDRKSQSKKYDSEDSDASLSDSDFEDKEFTGKFQQAEQDLEETQRDYLNFLRENGKLKGTNLATRKFSKNKIKQIKNASNAEELTDRYLKNEVAEVNKMAKTSSSLVKFLKGTALVAGGPATALLKAGELLTSITSGTTSLWQKYFTDREDKKMRLSIEKKLKILEKLNQQKEKINTIARSIAKANGLKLHSGNSGSGDERVFAFDINTINDASQKKFFTDMEKSESKSKQIISSLYDLVGQVQKNISDKGGIKSVMKGGRPGLIFTGDGGSSSSSYSSGSRPTVKKLNTMIWERLNIPGEITQPWISAWQAAQRQARIEASNGVSSDGMDSEFSISDIISSTFTPDEIFKPDFFEYDLVLNFFKPNARIAISISYSQLKDRCNYSGISLYKVISQDNDVKTFFAKLVATQIRLSRASSASSYSQPWQQGNLQREKNMLLEHLRRKRNNLSTVQYLESGIRSSERYRPTITPKVLGKRPVYDFEQHNGSEYRLAERVRTFRHKSWRDMTRGAYFDPSDIF